MLLVLKVYFQDCLRDVAHLVVTGTLVLYFGASLFFAERVFFAGRISPSALWNLPFQGKPTREVC